MTAWGSIEAPAVRDTRRRRTYSISGDSAASLVGGVLARAALPRPPGTLAIFSLVRVPTAAAHGRCFARADSPHGSGALQTLHNDRNTTAKLSIAISTSLLIKAKAPIDI